MVRRYRSLLPPTVLILAFTAGGLGCDTEAKRQQRALAARQNQAWEDGQRRQAETEPPTPEVTAQVATATQAFMAEHHPTLLVEGTTFTPMTPNLFLVGVAVKDLLQENRYVAQLTAERLRDVDWGDEGEVKENGQILWVIGYADPAALRVLAQRHGFQAEVDRIEEQDRDGDRRPSWGHRSWLDSYLLWAVLFHRPGSYGANPGGGFRPLAPGYRLQDPGNPITPEDARRYQGAAAPTGGRSSVFLGGSAWRPPLVSNTGATLPGQAFLAGPRGGIAGKAAMGSVSRGGFGAAGHAAGAGG